MARGRGSVRVSITGDADSLVRETGRADRALEKLGTAGSKHLKTAGTAAGILDSRLGKLAKAASAAGAAYLAIAEAKEAVNTTVSLGKATISLNRNLGIGIERASEWATVAKVRGIETKQLNQAFGTLAKNETAAADGAAKQTQAFKDLGVSQGELKRLDFNQLLSATADGFNKMEPGARRTADAMALFGRGWQTIVPVLRSGSKAMEEQLGLAKQYGATFSGGTIKSVEDLIDAQREAKFATIGLQIAFGTTLAPALSKVIPAIARFINQIRTGTGSGGELRHTLEDVAHAVISTVTTFQRLGRFVSDVFGLFSAATRGTFPRFIGVLMALFNPFTRAAALARHFGDVVGGLRAIFQAAARVFGNVMAAILRGFAKLFDAASHLPFVGDKFDGLAERTRRAASAVDQLGEEVRNLKSKAIDVKVRIAVDTAQGFFGGGKGGDGWGIERHVDRAVGSTVQRQFKKDPGSLLGGLKGGAVDLMGANANLGPFAMLGSTYGLSVVSGLRPRAITSSGNVSYHASGRAIDVDRGSASAMLAYGLMMAATFGGKLKELIHTPMGFSIKNGQRVAPYAQADHYDHVHVAMQRGGRLAGARTGDLNPAWLEDGEFVVNRKATAAAGPWLEMLNRGIPRFQQGGRSDLAPIGNVMSRGSATQFARSVWGMVSQLGGRGFGGKAPRLVFGRDLGGPTGMVHDGRIYFGKGFLRAIAGLPNSLIADLTDRHGNLLDKHHGRNLALNTVVHEMAHAAQPLAKLSRWEREGGAEAFTQWAAPQVYRRLGVSYGPTPATYPNFVQAVNRRHTAGWIRHGQFLQKGGKAGAKKSGNDPWNRALVALQRAGFRGNALQVALAVGGAESVSYTDMTGDASLGGSYGPWQIHHPSHPEYDTNRLQSDWTYAAKAAYQISDGGTDWGPWTTYNTGAYRGFMGRAAQVIAGGGGGGGGAKPGGGHAEFGKGKAAGRGAGKGVKIGGNLNKAKPGQAGKVLQAIIEDASTRTGFAEAMAALTPGQQDDIAAAFGSISIWGGVLDAALKSGDKGAATTAAQNLAGAKSTLADLISATTAQSDATQQLVELTKQSVDNQNTIIKYAQVQGPALSNLLLSGFSGGVGAKAGLVRPFPSFTGTGGLARY